MTYFEKVVDFNTQFGVKLNQTPQPDIFDTEPNTVSFCMKLIDEEHRELTEAVVNKDFVEVADAIADSIYVLLGMSARLGIDMDTTFNMVHVNNMSKLCKSEQEAQDSVEYYKSNPSLGFDTPNYRRAQDNIHWVVYNESTKKILKSINYVPVDLSYLLK